MTDNEKRQSHPKRTGVDAGRDGKMFEKNDLKPVSKGSHVPSNYSSDRPRRNDEKYAKSNYEKRHQDKSSFHSERRFDQKPSSGRARFSVKKQINPNSTEYVETRFDNSGGERRRPRIRTADYNPNAKYSKKKQAEYRRDEIDPTKPIRLNKFLANAGICSSQADEFIAAEDHGQWRSCKRNGRKVLPTDKVMFHNQQVRIEKKVYILLNKPKDTVTTAEDNLDRRTVLDIVKNACSERIYPVGRLDRNTTGVLLLTNDGDLASRLTHPRFEKKKIYHAVLDKPLEIPDFESILSGVMLMMKKLLPMRLILSKMMISDIWVLKYIPTEQGDSSDF